MGYKLSLRKQPGQQLSLVLSGQLNIKNSILLHAELLKYAQMQQGMRLQVSDVEELDASFLQLLLALRDFHAAHQKPFSLQLTLEPVHQSLMEISGISSALTETFE